MINYKKIMGYSNKKKVVKEQQPKSKKNQILEGIKKDLNEWNDTTFRDKPKRWSNSSGLTEYEQELKEVSAAPQYKKMYKDIIKAENQLAKSVDKMASFLNKKGLKNQSMMLKGNYIQDVRDFVDKFLKGFIKELL